MEILIVSYYFYPELTPRSFRTTELVNELCQQGHNVTVCLPRKLCYTATLSEKKNLRFIFSDYIKTFADTIHKVELERPVKKRKLVGKFIPKGIKQFIKALLEKRETYFFPIRDKIYIKSLSNTLIKLNNSYDIFISIALPIECHIASIKAFKRNRSLNSIPLKIAEYGDPFSRRKEPIFFYYYWIDFIIAKKFNYIVVPTELAVKSFELFKNKNKIKIIPQGFNLNKTKVNEYKKNTIPTFAFAGSFYAYLRNPTVFLNYLSECNFDFKFVVYTISENIETITILNEFVERLGNKLEIKYNLSRDLLIEELSRMDFLVNIENISNNQTPSKLIDYAIAQRPICTISILNFNPNLFNQFINGDYKNKLNIDLENFDIKNVVSKFLELN